MPEDQREGFDDLLENFNRAMMDVDPESVHLDALSPLRVAFVKLHAALRRNAAGAV